MLRKELPMKIDAIYHSVGDRKRERRGDPGIRRYSKDPVHHPMMLEREYVRALNATKMDRIFSKPFVAAFEAAGEGIWCIAKDPESSVFAAASYDNKVTIWDIYSRTKLKEEQFNERIPALMFNEEAGLFVAQNNRIINGEREYMVESGINSVDYTNNSNLLAVGSSRGIHLFDTERYTPKAVYEKSDISTVKLNISFKHTMAGVDAVGRVILYDIRVGKEFASVKSLGANCLAFNPQLGFTFATGNEDGSSYIYDMRELEAPLNVLRGHVGPVVSLCYSPDGREIASGSFDHTIRIFGLQSRKARDCYYNNRMHIVYGLAYSNDGQFIVSGSDDGSLRLWKAQASRKVGAMTRHEKLAVEYRESLKEKFKNTAEIARISGHRFLPRDLKHRMRTQHEAYQAALRREEKIQKEREKDPKGAKFHFE